uniref:DUF1249 domain-containing protein n=1 Tax=uncultured Thiotrichaceae bacterium TaxID=298394 RepID=A0A6S6TNY8_9GAMM|nr:MAG: Unknown protein [uncultured Thiotrichaceae bacterium]
MLIKEPAQYMVAPRPQSFAALMDMYEVNYIQLRLLLGDLRKLDGELIARSENHLPFSVEVKEQSRHTLILLLTYHFEDDNGDVVDTRPDLMVRIYHDALQAEVVTHKCRFSDQRVRYWWKKNDSMLLCRWRMNRFLFKWLRYLRRHDYALGDMR